MITIQLTEEEGKILFEFVSDLIDDPDLDEKDEDEIKMWTMLYWALANYFTR